MGDRHGRDQRVDARAAGVRPDRRSDAATCPNARAAALSKAIGSKRLGLLEMCLAAGPLFVGRGHQRTNRELGERDRRDLWLLGNASWSSMSREDQLRSSDLAGGRSSVGSMTASRRRDGWVHVAVRPSILALPRRSPCARPARPPAFHHGDCHRITARRSTTSPPWFRRSRMSPAIFQCITRETYRNPCAALPACRQGGRSSPAGPPIRARAARASARDAPTSSAKRGPRQPNRREGDGFLQAGSGMARH